MEFCLGRFLIGVSRSVLVVVLEVDYFYGFGDAHEKRIVYFAVGHHFLLVFVHRQSFEAVD